MVVQPLQIVRALRREPEKSERAKGNFFRSVKFDISKAVLSKTKVKTNCGKTTKSGKLFALQAVINFYVKMLFLNNGELLQCDLFPICHAAFSLVPKKTQSSVQPHPYSCDGITRGEVFHIHSSLS